jgi:hypothetical protein
MTYTFRIHFELGRAGLVGLDRKFADGVQLTVVAHAPMRCDAC